MDQEAIDRLYDELLTYSIDLHPDPRIMGPAFLNDQIATCRNYLNAVTRHQLRVSRALQQATRRFHNLETAYAVAYNDLLANDARVRPLPSIEDRKATVAMLLREERAEIDRIKGGIGDLEHVVKAINLAHKELTGTMSEIRLQRSLIQAEVQTGQLYGDERTREGAAPTQDSDESPMSPEELERIFREVSEGGAPSEGDE